jgi:hypothetical protein
MLWCVVGMATNERKSVVLQLFAHFCLGAEINLRIFSKQEHQAPTQHRTSQQRELCGDGETKHAKGWERPRAHTLSLSLPVGVTQHRKWLGWVQDQLTNCFIASLILVMAAGQPRRHPAASTGAHSPTNTASRCPSGLAQAVLCGCYGRLLCVGPTA